MRLWRLIHGLRMNFSFLLLAVLICEGLIALPMMFIFPPAALLMVFVGLGTLALSIILQGMLSVADNSLARLLGIEIPPIEGDEPSP
ncbi:MAG: hypothetical protein VX527_06290 [Planctomycetota bacterium]|nr:hypothetical protein [Planctomycetota bacterium]